MITPPLPSNAITELLVDRIYPLATQNAGLTGTTRLIARHAGSRSCALLLQDRSNYRAQAGWYWGIDHVWAAA